jgi:hypothetical protein
MARTATLAGDAYEVSVLPSGVVALARDRVARVDSLSREDFLRRFWEEISANTARMKNPIDLYVKAVTRCFRWGLERQGYEILEALLAMPASAQVPAIFIQETAGDPARLWEQAAGRAPLDQLPGLVAIAAPPPRAPPEETPGQPVRPATAVPGDLRSLAAALADVRRRLSEAQVIYQRVVTGGGELKELHAARAHLEAAGEILRRLPPEAPEVRHAKRQTAELLQAVVKSLPF